jgi:hypothetical protein
LRGVRFIVDLWDLQRGEAEREGCHREIYALRGGAERRDSDDGEVVAYVANLRRV